MSRALAWVWWTAAAIAAFALFWLLQSKLPLLGMHGLEAHPEVIAQLEASLQDQRRLATDHPEDAATYRARFEDTQRLLRRMRIVELSRPQLSGRFRVVLWSTFGALVVGGLLLYAASRRRTQYRLSLLQGYLDRLSRGETHLQVGNLGRDAIGRIARMIARTSKTVAAERRRAEQLEHLGAWQEGARRVVHEIRTPLTAAQLDVARIEDRLGKRDEPETRRTLERLQEEMQSIHAYLQRLASFARMPTPEIENRDLSAFVREFVDTFEDAFAPMQLRCDDGSAQPLPASFDAHLLRQALVNLCRNAAEANAEDRGGRIDLSLGETASGPYLEVRDDGPGVPQALREHLFKPYFSSKPNGRGMGLGLAISRKILLDQGGELSLVDNEGPGACFRLSLTAHEQDRSAAPETMDGAGA